VQLDLNALVSECVVALNGNFQRLASPKSGRRSDDLYTYRHNLPRTEKQHSLLLEPWLVGCASSQIQFPMAHAEPAKGHGAVVHHRHSAKWKDSSGRI